VLRFVYFLALASAPFSLTGFAALPSAQDVAKSIRQTGLDPEECYRVRDLSYQKEDIHVYFNDGYLIFSKPLAGERRAAVFAGDIEGGDGEVLLLPPTRGERQSLAMFTKSANLDEHFRNALLIFSGGATQELLDQIHDGSGKKTPEMGAVLAEKWAPVLANIESGFEMRMVEDMLAPHPDGGIVFLAISSRDLGNFDVLYDPRAAEQVVAGQLREQNGGLVYDIWTSFPSRSSRKQAAKPQAPWFAPSSFRIDASFDADLKMKVTTRITLRVGERPLRVFPFDISRAMAVHSVKIDGAPAELFVQDSLRGRALRGNDNDVFLAVSPEPLAAGSEHQFEFEHEGAVVTTAGSGVYYVGARNTWYPRSSEIFANYDLTFHYPKRLTLVACGEMADDRVDGDLRVTHWRTPNPIRMAGFNLGDYDKVSGSVPGYTINVYGNRHLQSSLEPKPPQVEAQPPAHKSVMERVTPNASAPVEVPPDPSGRLHAVADDVSSALEFFAANFGPPALKTLTVAPIPGTFGQGFPGLVYLSTISYLNPNQRPPALRDPSHALFFSELMEAHEVAHQWWGNVVTVENYQDQWLLEALANDSALLWLEKKKGLKAAESVLTDYRDHLLSKDETGRTFESAGPITWGPRLLSTGDYAAWRAITYEKGAWILHMLRERMGDERYLKMLGEMRRRYQFRSITTENFRDLVTEFSPPHTDPAVIELFFDNWVYATGVPSLKLKSSVRGLRVTGSLAQSGVDDDFSVDVPVEIQFAKGAPQTIWVRTSNEGATFSATVKQAPIRVVLGGVLTKAQ
jgi:Peptidase family M1 domain